MIPSRFILASSVNVSDLVHRPKSIAGPPHSIDTTSYEIPKRADGIQHILCNVMSAGIHPSERAV